MIILGIHVVHAVTLDRIIEYREVPFHSPRLPAELDGYTIAFIADTHTLSVDRLRGIVRELNPRQIDMLILGGDHSKDHAHLLVSMEILAQTATTDGIFGVEGNHDAYWQLFAAMEANGIVPLSNSGVHIHENFFLAGVEDLWNRRPNIAMATQGAGPDDFVLLVSHNPDVTMQQDTTGVDLILSGHTHGGQITFFGVWAPYLIRGSITDYNQRFRGGWARSRDGTPVYVTNGTAVNYYFVPRVFARPQVILITLHGE